MVRVKLSESCSMEAIGLGSLNIFANSLEIPAVWEKYRENWSIPILDCTYNDTQLLISCDRVNLHPKDIMYRGKIVSTGNARLKVSWITGRYLAYGFNRDNATVVATDHTSFYPDSFSPADNIITTAVMMNLSRPQYQQCCHWCSTVHRGSTVG